MDITWISLSAAVINMQWFLLLMDRSSA